MQQEQQSKGWGSFVFTAAFIILCFGFVSLAIRPNCTAEYENTALPVDKSQQGTNWEKKALDAEAKVKKLEKELGSIENKITELEVLAEDGPEALLTAVARGGDYLTVVEQGCENERMKVSKKFRLSFVDEGHTVHGYLFHPVPYITAVLSQYQHSISICGDVGEVGVHRGRFGLAICHTMTTTEKYLAADIYDLDIGVNTAGGGGLFKSNTVKILTDNLHQFGLTPDDYIVKRADSTTLKPHDLYNNSIGPFRLFSIDGGHAWEVVLNDLILVSQIVVEGAIVAMDDWDAPNWPGIREGFVKYWNVFKERDIPLVPLLWCANKMFVTTASHHQIYFDFIQNHTILKTFVGKITIEGPWKILSLTKVQEPQYYNATLWKDLINSMD